MAKGGYQKQRLEQRKAEERARRRRKRQQQRILLWSALPLLGLLLLLAFFPRGEGRMGLLFLERGGPPSPTASPTPGASASPTPTPCRTPAPDDKGKKTFDAPPCVTIDVAKTYSATLKTNQGDIKLDLLDDAAPKTVNNFVFLARNDFYDGLTFHRVIPGFMIQGGDPEGTGSGGPGYQFEDENFASMEQPGTLAMANSGPTTNGSQFFITVDPIQHLNAKGSCPGPQGCHSVFGRVTEGLEVARKITGVPRDKGDKPKTPVVIEDIVIEER